jgi:hypothetical protein
MMGGQNLVTFGAVPPYSTGLYDLNMNSSNYAGAVYWLNTYLATTDGSKNF